MKRVLVDSSVWISYFRDKSAHQRLDDLIQNNQICTNNLVLAELLPSLHLKEQEALVELMLEVPIIELSINWELIINFQIHNLRNEINKIGIPDLILVDSVLANNLIWRSFCLTLWLSDNMWPLLFSNRGRVAK